MDSRATPIAVIGMGCRLPGGIDSPDAFWDALLRGDDLVTEIPADRWNIEDHYDPERGVKGRSVSRWGGFIDDIGGFDASFFGFGEREATAIDPQHRLLLETSWEAIEHAGIAPPSLTGSRTGVFVGLCHHDYTVVTSDAGALDDAYGFTGTPFSMASGRIAYGLGLLGPAITVDTSCSSGLVALHMACQSLDTGESNLALAGAAMALLESRVSAAASAQGMLSPTGRCHTFDVAADGFVRSEGCGVVLLKRLPDALRDGDRILAVVRGTAANQDGRSETITTPSAAAQAAVYRAALEAAGVDPATVGMVEAHGTGTPVGDPLEFTSLTEVYGAGGNRVALGSAKSNLGHTEGAAGAIGLIKAVLGLQHGVVPPMVHFSRLPDELQQIETGLFVPEKVTPWPDKGDGPRRAGVTSFGMSGTNVHAVLEQAPETQADAATPDVAGPLVFPLSSTSAAELRRTAQRLAEWVDDNAGLVVSDLAYTLARRRGHRTVRTTVIADNLEGLAAGLREIADGETPYPPAAGHDDRGPVWIFSGQGSQWAAMGAELLAKEPVFAATVAEAEPLIARESGFSVTEAMSAPETVTGIDRVQPTLFTFQVALATAMRAYGVQPGAVIGHSLGEASAAVIAGALSLADGAKVICRRSKLMSRIAGAGAMASVELPAQQVRDQLAARGVTDVVVSVIASPGSTVIGGATQTVRDLVAEWESREVMAREVAVDVASHSSQVDPILADLADQLADLTPTTPKVPYYSATLDNPRTPPTFGASYWVDNLRQPVRFAAAVQAALDDGHRVFGESSPHPLLTRAVEQTASAADITVQALAGMRREQPTPFGIRGFLADLYSAGAAVDFSVLYPSGRLVDAPLPTWTHQRLLVASDGSGSRGESTVPVHPLLGAHVRLPEDPERHAWQGEIGTAALPWLADHQVNGVAVFPGAGFCEMALAAAATVLGPGSEVRDVRFEQMLMLDDETSVSAVASVEDAGIVDFVVETDREGERTRRATAVLHAADETDQEAPQRRDIAALLATHPHRVEGSALRESFTERGIQYGPAFTGLVSGRTAEGKGRSVVAEIGLPSGVRSQQAGYDVHPALLDACFQSVMAYPTIKDATQGVLLPLSVRRLRRYSPTRGTRYCHLRVTPETSSDSGSIVEVDLDLLDENGAVLLAVQGLRMGTSGGGGADQLMNERLLTIDWQPQTLPPLPERAVGGWLLINTAEADLLESRLTDAMKSLGAQCITLNWPEHADHLANAEQLATQVRGGLEGVVIVCPPHAGEPDEEGLLRGREQVRHVIRMIRELPELAGLSGEPPRLYVVTRQAQIVLPDDRPNLVQAGLRGLLRVIGAENPQLRPSQIDLEGDGDIDQAAQEIVTGSQEDETAWRGGQWYAARLRCMALGPDERRVTTVKHESDRMRVTVRHPGDLRTLEFIALDRMTPGAGQVEIAVDASSLNFLDVLAALGRYPDLEGRPHQLGFDLGGVVTRVGADVTGHQVGDRVGGFSGYANGCWGTFVTCDARLVATLPPGLTAGEAAAAATGYGTAWYGLCDLARMTAEDKVLIHSGTGGVGQAAIAIAHLVGAEIFATAGSPQRRAMLRDMGIEHVYDSRSTEFAEQIRRDTDGYGVDIVLNSLTGAAQRAGLNLLAYGGRFVEIGKRDIYGDTRLGLFPFRRNLTFYAVDLALLSETHPRRLQELLRTVYQRVADGDLPRPVCTEYPLSEAATAIRVMSGAEHTGKLVLTVPHTGETRAVVPPEQAPVFRDDGAYIVTGGLGGLGLFLAGQMAKAGCGRIVLTARSNPNPKARQAIERLRAAGADIVVECGNIAEADTVARVVAAATTTGLPLRGVLHAAAVVEDATLANITDELIDRDWAPKVNGVWNLHQALHEVEAGQPLDWFCSFSSVAALFGSAGQGAYAAASSWLDAFTHWRRSQGLPASTIAWGAWGEIGRATFLAAGGRTTMIAPEEGAQAFETLLRYDRGYTGYVPTTGAPWLAALVARSPFAEAFKGAGDQHSTESSTLRAELRTLSQDEWPARLRRLVAEQTGLILRRAVDPDRPFADHGLDSLGNLELRTRIEAETGVRVTPKAIATYNTARVLGQHLSEALATDGPTSGAVREGRPS
jgi:acyl transferase domain-containing protein/acyl carrier protein